MSVDDPPEILLVEDDSGDVRLIEKAFETTGREPDIHTATDGYEALHFLKRRATDASASLPDLALLDLNVPGKDGCDVLEAIRADSRLRCLPVIVFSDSTDGEDVRRCYEANANAYFTKPTDPDELDSLIAEIDRFWFDRVQLPPTS